MYCKQECGRGGAGREGYGGQYREQIKEREGRSEGEEKRK